MDTKDFVSTSILDVLVPQASDVDVEELLSTAEDQTREGLNGRSLAASIPQRDILYFDESIPIYVVIRTPYHDESQLKSSLDRLEITVEAQAFGYVHANPTGQDGPKESPVSQSRDVIWSDSVDMSQEPIIVVQQEDDQVADRHVFIVWRLQAFLSRPRVRIQSPMITFKPVAILRFQTSTGYEPILDPYLPDCTSQSINLFESLKSERILQGVEPQLSAFGLSQNASAISSLNSTHQKLTTPAQRAFRTIPAISARVRYTRSKGDGGKSTIVASLDIETAPFYNNDIRITMVGLSLPEGLAEDLSHGHTLALPMTCRPKDNQVFLFRLTPNGNIWDGSNSSPRTIDVRIDATILVSDICRPRIQMRWKAGVDFSTALNPSYGTPNQPMQRDKRPASLPVPPVPNNGNGMPAASSGAESYSGPDSSPNRSRSTSVNDLSVTITFTAPRAVHVGVSFSWDVFVVNRSSRPRKLAVMVIPKRKRNEVKGHLSKPSSSSAGGAKAMGNANAVLDETHLYALQRNSSNDAVQIVSLSTDVKLGLLSPGFCRNTELKFLPLAKGILSVEAVRVVDVVTNESIDVRDLPDIVAQERLNHD